MDWKVKMTISDGMIVKGTIVLVRNNKLKLKPNNQNRERFFTAENAVIKEVRKKKVRVISKFADLARYINQGDEARAIAEDIPTDFEASCLPSRKTSPRQENPKMAAAAREPNSLAPQILWVTAISQKPAGG